MADLHIEDSTEGEEWETGGEREGERESEREREREHLCESDLKMI